MTDAEGGTTYSLGRWLVREDWPLWALLVAAFVVAGYLYPTLPERVPTGWDVHGQVNRWGSRAFGTFGTLGIALGVYVLIVVIPLIDPRRASYPRFLPTLRVVRWGLVVVFLSMWGVAVAAAKGAPVPVERIVPATVAILFIVLGNVVGRIRYNWFVGIRTPWSLSSEEAWRLTHRTSGPVWVLGGLVSLAGAFLGGRVAVAAMIAGVGGAASFSVIYSYFAFRRVAGTGA
jgi:uncharacterized membrane protein